MGRQNPMLFLSLLPSPPRCEHQLTLLPCLRSHDRQLDRLNLTSLSGMLSEHKKNNGHLWVASNLSSPKFCSHLLFVCGSLTITNVFWTQQMILKGSRGINAPCVVPLTARNRSPSSSLVIPMCFLRVQLSWLLLCDFLATLGASCFVISDGSLQMPFYCHVPWVIRANMSLLHLFVTWNV